MSRKLLVGTVLVSAGILVAVFSSSRSSSIYSRSVSEFLAHPIREQPVRVQGTLVPGSLCRRENPCEWHFSLADRWVAGTDGGPPIPKAQLPIRYAQCVVPDTFRDGPEVTITIEGELCKSCHRFEATTIMARNRHVHGYEMKQRGKAFPAPPTWTPMPLCSGS